MKFKRSIITLLMLGLLLMLAIPAMAAPKVIVDGNQLTFDVDPIIENGRTLVPLRAIFEALGADVNWDGTTQTAIAIKDNTQIKLQIVSQAAYKNGTLINLDVPAKIINGRTMVPIRFVSESLGCRVAWNNNASTVIIASASSSLSDEDMQYLGKTVWAKANWGWSNNAKVSNLEPLIITNITKQPTNDPVLKGQLYYFITLQKSNEENFVLERKELENLIYPCYLTDPYTTYDWTPQVWNYIKEMKVFIGMTAEQAKMSWGEPKDTNRTITASGTLEQWVYGLDSYLYFKDGVLETIQN